MLARLTIEYIYGHVHSGVSAAVGFVIGLPAMVLAVVQGDWVLIALGIAGGVFAFLYTTRKYPIEEIVTNANRAIRENFALKDRNATLAAENEQLRVRLAHLEEGSKTTRLQDPKP